MTLSLNYVYKKDLKTKIGQPLWYEETSICGLEYKSTGIVYGCGPRRNWFAQITMKDDLIVKVK